MHCLSVWLKISLGSWDCLHQLAQCMLSKNKRPYDPEQQEPRRRLRRNLQDLLAKNELPANRIGEIARDVNRVDSSSFADIAATTASTSHEKRNVMRKFKKHTTWMPVYWAQIRCTDTKTKELKPQWIAFKAIHEIVHVLKKLGDVETLMNTDGMDPLTKQHLDECQAEAQTELLGLGIWTDGTPCNWDRSETIETVSLSIPGLTGKHAAMRIPVTALPAKNCTKETWIDVCQVIKWFLQILATGVWPTCRHDGSPWRKTDACRKKPRELMRACLVEIRADWDWMTKVWGLPAHNLLEGICWKCPCTPSQVTWLFPL